MRHQVKLNVIKKHMKTKTIQLAVAANAITKENKRLDYCLDGIYRVMNHNICVFKTKSLEKAVDKYNKE